VQVNTSVKWIKRNIENTKWQVRLKTAGTEETRDFDKVVICNGLTAKAVSPRFEGVEKFKGKIIHVQAFKRYVAPPFPSGLPLSQKQTFRFQGHESPCGRHREQRGRHIYPAHRPSSKDLSLPSRRSKNRNLTPISQNSQLLTKLQLPRICLGAPLDLVITRQKNILKFALDKYTPALSRWLFDWTIEQYSKKSFKLDPSWRLSPAPSLANHQPVISDNLVDSLWARNITSVHGIYRFVDDYKVELTDRTVLRVDAVIFCTGYEPDFSLTPEFSPLKLEEEEKSRAGINDAPLARLYQNIFPPQYADSLAYMNYVAPTDGAITIIDLAAMAIAQIWKGASVLPSIKDMNAEISNHHKWIRHLGKDDSVYVGIVRPGLWFAFLNRAAGTGVGENLGYGWEGWKFWLRERKLRNLMMRGVMTPFMYRVFEGRRKRWEGARKAIFHVNEMAKAYSK